MNFNSLTDLHQALKNKEISAQEVVKQTFAEIKEKEPKIAAFISLNEESSLKYAGEIDEKGDF